MTLTLNGEAHAFDGPPSLQALVASLGLDPRKVAVERNLEVVPRSTLKDVCVEDGDDIEIVHFVGGGDHQAPIVDDTWSVAGKTFRWSGRYHADMVSRDTLDTQLNCFADFNPKLPESYASSPLVLLGNIHPALQLQVLEQVSEPELVVCDTMNFWIEGEADALAKVLEKIDVLVINDEEARLLSGIHNIARAAKDILARGPSKLVIKRGEYGSLYFDDEGIFAAPALILEEVADPTGAGDSFAGGFLGYLATRPTIDHAAMRLAMVHGTATASYCVEALGPSNLVGLTRDQVKQRVQQIRELYHLAD